MGLISSLAILSAFAVPTVAMANTINVSGTGVNISAGTQDSHYTVSGPGVALQQAIAIIPNGAWGAQNTYNNAPGASNWINPGGNGDTSYAGGTYTYTTTFNLAGDFPNTAELVGRFASDNAAAVYLNGVFSGYENTYSSPSFASFTGFDLTKGFVSGVNTLQFIVMNGNGAGDTDGPTGLIVKIDSGSASPVPEPSSMLLLGTGLLSVAGAARRKFGRP